MHFVVDPKKFNIFKEALSRKFNNFRAEQPYSHAFYYGEMLLDSQFWTVEEAGGALEGEGGVGGGATVTPPFCVCHC